jgi:hypothetical protein
MGHISIVSMKIICKMGMLYDTVGFIEQCCGHLCEQNNATSGINSPDQNFKKIKGPLVEC